ncbi:MAG TPA: hypothetical protein VHE10_02935 [Candidatus Paceibacterota bacterium]|nr:hypothetical protein [Candidatus Paceibacterota bacterium]
MKTTKTIIRAALLAAIFAVFGAALGADKARAASVTVYVPEKYASVHAGERLYFQIEALFPENDMRRDFQISYRVLEDGKPIADAEFVKAIETQASFVDFVIVPEKAKAGRHAIEVRVSNAQVTDAKASASFDVESDFNWLVFYAGVLLAAVAAVGVSLSLEIQSLRKSVENR